MKRALGVLLILAGCSETKFEATWSSAGSIVRGATRVEASILDRPDHDPKKPRNRDFWAWKPVGDPVVVDPATATRIADILLNENSYYRGSPKACIPEPGVKLRFLKGAQAATVLFCFECRMLFVQTDGKTAADDFDPAAPALVDIVKQLFPKDPVLQSLK